MEEYFIIRNLDGDTHVENISKKALLERLNEEDYGSDVKFLDEIPNDDSDTNYWGEGILIIKGEIVTPKEKHVVTEFDIE
jgi:hypothetical protein